MLYLKWYLSLNGVLYFNTDINSLSSEGILTVFNGWEYPRKIKQITYYFLKDNKICSVEQGEDTLDPNEKLALIDPSIKKKHFLECIAQNHTIFFLSTFESPKEIVLKEHIEKLSTAFKFYNMVLLDEAKSSDILKYFMENKEIKIKYRLKFYTPLVHKSYILSCLLTISLCVLSIFYLVCGIYSSKNPIVTEFELNRFQVIKYKEMTKNSVESCLICFDSYNNEDEIRILLCKHYFHKDCVDKWLCEQSSRCPYCRCTNKYYDEIV
ncbi:RING finger protein [Nosema granulosis]|uniref:RING finger protein n=1 Tax=Nosema granulosis TaxID=83296 RepID=A0A9P6GZB4_9MICR|nr:RING finger protein [Nosema granulosis]